MNDPDWYEALPRWAQKAVDQIGHVGIGGGTAGLAGGLASIWLSGGWAGLLGGSVGSLAMGLYELIQNVGDAVNDIKDMATDLAFGIGSAILVGLVIWAFA